MQAINNVFKWSLYLTALFSFIVVGGVFAIWFTVEALTFLVHISD